MEFKAAYDALRRLAELDGFRRQNRSPSRDTKLLSEYQPPREQGLLKRKSKSAAIDAGNMDLHDSRFDYAREKAELAQGMLPTTS